MVRSIVAGVFAVALIPAMASAQPQGAPPVTSYPAQPYPSQSYPGQTYPGPSYPAQSYPAQSYPAPGYQRPVYGDTLPREWVTPAYYIANFDSYDLPVPAAGFGWSRYFDDAVLTDRWGRVYDVRYDFESDRDGNHHRRNRRQRDDDDGYGGYAVPHWDMGYVMSPQYGDTDGYGPATGDGDGSWTETTTTTTTTYAPPARPTRRARGRYRRTR